jgi:hypothetical protein
MVFAPVDGLVEHVGVRRTRGRAAHLIAEIGRATTHGVNQGPCMPCPSEAMAGWGYWPAARACRRAVISSAVPFTVIWLTTEADVAPGRLRRGGTEVVASLMHRRG